MLSLHEDVYMMLRTEAGKRGISVQEMLRAVVIADWFKTANGKAHDQSLRRDGEPSAERGSDPFPWQNRRSQHLLRNPSTGTFQTVEG